MTENSYLFVCMWECAGKVSHATGPFNEDRDAAQERETWLEWETRHFESLGFATCTRPAKLKLAFNQSINVY